MDRLRFYLNDRLVEESGLSPTTTVLRYLRDRAAPDRHQGRLRRGRLRRLHRGRRSSDDGEGRPGAARGQRCLLLLPMVQGKRVYTVEALQGAAAQYHPVQEAMAKRAGLAVRLLHARASSCRCSRPATARTSTSPGSWTISCAATSAAAPATGPSATPPRAWRALAPADRFARALAETQPEPMELDYAAGAQRSSRPARSTTLWDVLDAHPGGALRGGRHGPGARGDEALRRAAAAGLPGGAARAADARSRDCAGYRIGAGGDADRARGLRSRGACPPLERMLRYFGARQIKNRATLGGNLCTASPIGDLAPVLLSLGRGGGAALARGRAAGAAGGLLRRTTAGRRCSPGRSLGLRGRAGAALGGAASIAYKVSKRRELDISIRVGGLRGRGAMRRGASSEARLAYGGMARHARLARGKTEAALVGQALDGGDRGGGARPARRGLHADRRSSRLGAGYRAQVAQNLLRGFFEETLGEPSRGCQERHAATVQVR